MVTLEPLPYSEAGTAIMPSMSPPSSGTLPSLLGELGLGLAPRRPTGAGFSRDSGSVCLQSLALRFFSDRSLPMGPGLYSFVSGVLSSGS